MTASIAGGGAADSATAKDHVRAIVARSGSSFLWGMRILPSHRRDAMYAIYAFCREVDDAADEPNLPEVKLEKLAHWRREIARLYSGHPAGPVGCALLGPVAEFSLPAEEFLAVIEGMEMDVRSAIVAPSFEVFTLYCRRVAGAVGMLSIRVFGDTSAAAQELAVVQGEALQITNVLRDVAEDAARGRLYLPGDLLAKHGMAGLGPDQVLDHPGLAAACAELAVIAKDRFARARELMSLCDRRRLRPARLMLDSYGRILGRLEARGWDRPRETVRLSRLEKIWVALRCLIF
jgi:presqualene diphosphate synthase